MVYFILSFDNFRRRHSCRPQKPFYRLQITMEKGRCPSWQKQRRLCRFVLQLTPVWKNVHPSVGLPSPRPSHPSSLFWRQQSLLSVFETLLFLSLENNLALKTLTAFQHFLNLCFSLTKTNLFLRLEEEGFFTFLKNFASLSLENKLVLETELLSDSFTGAVRLLWHKTNCFFTLPSQST